MMIGPNPSWLKQKAPPSRVPHEDSLFSTAAADDAAFTFSLFRKITFTTFKQHLPAQNCALPIAPPRVIRCFSCATLPIPKINSPNIITSSAINYNKWILTIKAMRDQEIFDFYKRARRYLGNNTTNLATTLLLQYFITKHKHC